MSDLVSPRLVAASFVAATFFCPSAGTATEPTPLVVELFTSQGCSSCSPADRLLGELAEQDDVVPLSFHVTYWDRLGCSDTFALEDSTRRQETYADRLGLDRLYTPQMVIGGRIDVVGSARGRVLEAVELLRSHPEAGPELAVAGDRLSVGAGAKNAAAIWLIAFDERHDVAIGRGENRGRALRYHHVVRDIARLGDWRGQTLEIGLPLSRLSQAGRSGAAVLVQRRSDGVILAAAHVPVPQAERDDR
jgi:hypothetical protein